MNVLSKYGLTLVALLMSFQFFFISRSEAGVSVYPTFLFLNSPNRAISINVTNSGMTQTEVWVDFRYGYPVTNDSGGIDMRYGDNSDIAEPSASTWIRAFPQRFVLGPQESQTVRIVVSPPPGLPSGEFWSRVIFHSFPKEEINPKIGAKGGVRSGFKVLSNVDVPFHFRNGRVFTGIVVQKVTAAAEQGGLKVITDLNKSGNASYWGIIRFTLRDAAGHIVLTQDKKIAVYKGIHLQTIVNTSVLKPGTYTVEVELTTHRTDIRPENILPSEPVKKSISLTIS